MQIFVLGNVENKKRKVLNSILALATGILAILWPEFLYFIVGGYLIATGIVFMVFNFSLFLAAVSIVMGLLILNFPNLIPYFFAFFLLVLGLTTLFSGVFTFVGVIALVSAFFLIAQPGVMAYIIAAFLMFYGIFNLMIFTKDKSQISNH